MSENEKLERSSSQDAQSGKTGEKPAKVDKAKKDAKPEKKSKPGIFARIGKWFKEMKSELKKVQWPTAKQTVNNTVIVIVCCVVVGLFIGVFDWLAQSIISALLTLFKG